MRLGKLPQFYSDNNKNYRHERYRKMTNEEFYRIVDANTFITAQGIGVRNNPADFPAERQKAYSLFDEANICEYWLALCPRTKTIRKKLGTSKDLAVKFEAWHRNNTGHFVAIPVGAVLIAVIHLGLQFRRIGSYPGFYMNISNRRKIKGNWLNEYCLSGAIRGC